MTVQWRRLDAEPDLAAALERRRKEDGGEVLAELPPGWRGTAVPVADGVLAHAGRYFADAGVLAEVVSVWPGRRDAALERAILESVRVVSAQAGETLWEAMGLAASVGRECAFEGFGARAGLVEWHFRAPGDCQWSLQRLALPNFWLRGTLRDWLAGDVASEAEVTEVRMASRNGHEAAEVASLTRVPWLPRMLGRRGRRLDVAWHCPRENRVYRVRRVAPLRARGADASRPPAVLCCRPALPVGHAPPGAAPPRAAGVDLLASVPYVNRAATIAPAADGGALASVPLRITRRVAWTRWLLPLSDARRVQLDAMGARTLELCDGRRSVEQIAERLAADNGLTFREAQLSVAPFIRMLAERGILAVVGGA